MPVVPSEEIQRLRMSWEEFLGLPESPRTEWVDGEVLVMPPVAQSHGFVVGRLIQLLANSFPDLQVGTEIGVRLPRNRLRGPDVIVTERMTSETWVTEAPLLVAEVLSASTRAEDTIRKSMEYAEGGIGQYWIVDPELGTVDVLRNDNGAWQILAHLDDDHPAAEIALGPHGVVPLDLRSLLPR